MRGGLKIGKVAGIDIGIHYTWLFALVLFTWLFAHNLEQTSPGWSQGLYWVSGLIIAMGVFVSVLLHELAHSLVAIKRGMKVSSIVLFIFGGVSNIEKEPESAWTEFIMAAAGPASSLVLAAIFLGIQSQISHPEGQVAPAKEIFFYLFYVNLLLAAFNILPGFPLDGGRVFRAIIWGITRSLRTATLVAGNTGRVLGWAMILFGIFLVLGYSVGPFGGLLNGIWLIFIGWFISSAADNSMREQSLRENLTGKRVKDVMNPNPECVNPAASLASVVNDLVVRRGIRTLPVCNEKGLVGIVTLSDIKKVNQADWLNTPVQQIMTPAPLITVNEDDDLNTALNLLSSKDLNQVAVLAGGNFVGLLSREHVIRYLQTTKELGVKMK